jgi:hypothetical protein
VRDAHGSHPPSGHAAEHTLAQPSLAPQALPAQVPVQLAVPQMFGPPPPQA